MKIAQILCALLVPGLLLAGCVVPLPRSIAPPGDLRDSAPSDAQLLAAGEAGDVEAQRQLAHRYAPRESFGVPYGDEAQALAWYRRACAAGYANAQVDFYAFADTQARGDAIPYLDEAVTCLEDAIRQGHRKAILDGAFRAAFVDHDYQTGFYRYALLADTEPYYAEQRWSFADQLTQTEIDEAEEAARNWRAANRIRDYDDFFAVVNSPFRPVPSATPEQ